MMVCRCASRRQERCLTASLSGTVGDYVGDGTWTCVDGGCFGVLTCATSGQTACQKCLASCEGLEGCCTGSGCICEGC